MQAMCSLVVILCVICMLAGAADAWGETVEEVALRARSLLVDKHTFGVGVLSTTFPETYPDADLRGKVSSGAEYFASCYDNGDLLMLAMPVSQNWRNTLNSEHRNATFSVTSSADPEVPDPRHTSHSDKVWDPHRPSWRRGMPSKQRIAMFGHFERVNDEHDIKQLASCYLTRHPDAQHWAPGADDSPHVAFWVRFIVNRVYRVGGFGDESNIGWVNMALWHEQNVRDSASDTEHVAQSSDTSQLFTDMLRPPDAFYLD